MFARLEEGRLQSCWKKAGQDGSGRFHTNLPLYYEKNPEKAAEDGYYPVEHTPQPEEEREGFYWSPRWELQEIEGVTKIVQVWHAEEIPPEPVDPLEERDAKIDYLAMMIGVDFEEVAEDE